MVKVNNKWGVINEFGKEVLPFKYDHIYMYNEDFFTVYLDGKLGFISKKGNILKPLKYNEELRIVYEFLYDKGPNVFGVGVMRNKHKFLIDNNCKEIKLLKPYDEIDEFLEGKALVTYQNKCGFIDREGKEIVPLNYDYQEQVRYDPQFFSEGLAAVCKNKKWGFVNATGKIIIPFKYDYVHHFSEGLAGVVINDKWGYVEKTGKEVIPLQYDFVGHFNEGVGCVEIDNKIGFINKKGIAITPVKYENIFGWASECFMDFAYGVARVELDGKWGCIDRQGKVVIPLKYDKIERFYKGEARFKLEDKWGYIDTTGKITCQNKYDNIEIVDSGLYIATIKVNKYGFPFYIPYNIKGIPTFDNVKF